MLNKKAGSDFMIILKEILELLLVAGPILLPLLSYIYTMENNQDLNDFVLAQQIGTVLNSLASVENPSEVYYEKPVGVRILGIKDNQFYISGNGRFSKRFYVSLVPSKNSQFDNSEIYNTYSNLLFFERDSMLVGFYRPKQAFALLPVPEKNYFDSSWAEKKICVSSLSYDPVFVQFVKMLVERLNSLFKCYRPFVYCDAVCNCKKITIYLDYQNSSNSFDLYFASEDVKKIFALFFNELIFYNDFSDYTFIESEKNLIVFNKLLYEKVAFGSNQIIETLAKSLYDAIIKTYGKPTCTVEVE